MSKTLQERKTDKIRLEKELKQAKKDRINQIIADVDKEWLSDRDSIPTADVKHMVRLMAQWIREVME